MKYKKNIENVMEIDEIEYENKIDENTEEYINWKKNSTIAKDIVQFSSMKKASADVIFIHMQQYMTNHHHILNV